MKDGIGLWNERMQTYWQEAARYLRLIGNSGLLFTVYVLIIIGSYYYSIFLKWLPDQFPAMVVFIAVFAHFLTRGQVRTFLKRADIVFLLPYELKLAQYFRASKWYSFIFQAGLVTFVFVVLLPFYMKYAAMEAGPALIVLLMLLIVKGWNIFVSWEEERLQSANARNAHFLLRAFINAVFVYLLFSGAGFLYVSMMYILMAALFGFYYKKLATEHSFKWERLIVQEEQAVMFFYRIANMFTDVPQLRNRVNERRYFNWIIPLLAKEKASVYHYLFVRSFIRANDYAGVYVRIVLIAAIVLAFLPNGLFELVVLLLFMHLAMSQLKSLWYHFETSAFIDLYPVSLQKKKEALSEICFRLLFIMTVIGFIVLVLTSTFTYAALAAVIGVFYSYIGSRTLIHQRKK